MTKQQRALEITSWLADTFGVNRPEVVVTSAMPRNVHGLYYDGLARIAVRSRGNIATLLHEFAHYLVDAWKLRDPGEHGYLWCRMRDEVDSAFHSHAEYIRLCDSY